MGESKRRQDSVVDTFRKRENASSVESQRRPNLIIWKKNCKGKKTYVELENGSVKTNGRGNSNFGLLRFFLIECIFDKWNSTYVFYKIIF